MKLTDDMKNIMRLLYQLDNIKKYEFAFDKTDQHFFIRIFLDELSYLTISFPATGKCYIREYKVIKSSNTPSNRLTHINKHFKKYKYNGAWYAEVPFDTLVDVLPRLKCSDFADSSTRGSYLPWRELRRATGRY